MFSLPDESIRQFSPVDETTIGRFFAVPEFTLSRQLRVLFKRLGVSLTHFSDRTLIDKGVVSRITNERDHRGLNKVQTEKIVDFLKTDYRDDIQTLADGTVVKMHWREVDLWHKSIQCRASLERTLRNMFGPNVDLSQPTILKAAKDMLPAILSTWDETHGDAPRAAPPRDPYKYDYPALIHQFQQLSHLQRLLVFSVAEGLKLEDVASIAGLSPSEGVYQWRKIQKETDLADLPHGVMMDVIIAAIQREKSRQ